ncbi:putative ubiquitin conjugating enzyme [Microthyrium microscopicum]|uniref:Ubiquitin-conjugating enzyme E2 1 n=1 Tax=Microthyrium microscopicum TaxID=703497 RepID=A0A6A6UDG4_9PEZI|nr:putative ubiquitin conjugating enzyme [Microthyrium microscopicum]
MASARAKRINKEILEAKKDTDSKIEIEVLRDDLNNLRGRFPGPPDTPYEGGIYSVEIKIPSEYPFRPPKMKFETKVWHPNVSSVTGAICLDTLSSGWSPVLTVKSALMMLQSLLASPEPKDPQDAEVASMMIKHPKEFEHRAREWAVLHAGAPRKEEGESSGGADPHVAKKTQQAKEKTKPDAAQYRGYNKDLIDRFCAMGFEVPQVVAAFEYVGIDKMDGMDYELEEAYMGDITARLFGEP